MSATPSPINVAATSGESTVQVAAGSGCAWSATTATAWIGLPEGGARTGNGQLRFSVAANTGSGPDIFARTVAQVIDQEKLAPVRFQVANKVGGGGVTAANYMVERKGDAHTWGVFTSVWMRFVPASQTYADALRKEGGVADWWELPKLGVNGNTHMLMMDTNSDQIAQMIQKWMAEKGLML